MEIGPCPALDGMTEMCAARPGPRRCMTRLGRFPFSKRDPHAQPLPRRGFIGAFFQEGLHTSILPSKYGFQKKLSVPCSCSRETR